MINLYIDFDGVLVDTINVTYKIIDSLGIKINDVERVSKFYRELNWEELLSNIDEINEAFKNIELLEGSGLFNISILTTVNSLHEMQAKVNYIRKRNKKVSIICVPKGIEKCEVVNPLNSILIDDYSGNLIPWIEKGGIGIKFSNNDDPRFLTINCLSKVINEMKCKRLIRS